jgi:phenylalanyl-tRNA synthetase beta chain
LTANRSDCLSVVGVAREVAAMLDKDLIVPKIKIAETLDEEPNVQILDKNLCPRYTSRVLRGVDIKDSPEWIKRRLNLCGIRAINNLVDATNYVQIEYGHPTHAFDLNKLDGAKVVVRKAKKGEVLKTLDDVDQKIDDEMLVIADENKPVALAGVMGGANSEISAKTRSVLLESAYFDPISIRMTAKKLGVRTESSYRFEKRQTAG